MALSETLLYASLTVVAFYGFYQVFNAASAYINDYFNTVLVVHPNLNGVFYAVSYWTEKGGRPYQEDRYDMMKGTGHKDSSLYALFDGHGGAKASQYCKDHLLKYIQADVNFENNTVASIMNSFRKLDEEFTSIAKRHMLSDGSTAVVAVINDRKVYVANAGDSRAIIVHKGGKAKAMSQDHKPSREDEARRINNLGGKIVYWGQWRVQGVLAVSRSFGDISLKPYVTAEPEVMEKVITSDDLYLVLASDGLWDVMSNEDVARFLMNVSNFSQVAKELCYEATILGSADNITVVVVDLKSVIASTSVTTVN